MIFQNRLPREPWRRLLLPGRSCAYSKYVVHSHSSARCFVVYKGAYGCGRLSGDYLEFCRLPIAGNDLIRRFFIAPVVPVMCFTPSSFIRPFWEAFCVSAAVPAAGFHFYRFTRKPVLSPLFRNGLGVLSPWTLSWYSTLCFFFCSRLERPEGTPGDFPSRFSAPTAA